VTRIFSARMGFALAWLLAIGAGFAALVRYESRYVESSGVPKRFPADSRVRLHTSLPTLIMFAHPKCPCTRASVEELNRLLVQCSGRVSAQVWFFAPGQYPQEWAHSQLWHSVQAIPGVTAHEDADGAEAKRFGAASSGTVLLYDKNGQLLFCGGITAARGHVGNNAGKTAVISLANARRADIRSCPVYGCSLGDPERTQEPLE